ILATVAYQNLERRTSNVTPSQSFIQALYKVHLAGLVASPADVALWGTGLNGTGGRAGPAFCLKDSEVGLQTQGGFWYNQMLGFGPSAADLKFWVDRLMVQAPEFVLADFLASDNYFQRAGGTNDLFIRRLFLDLLFRGPSGNELSAFRDQLAQAGRF